MLLALETATSICSTALWGPDGCIAEASLHEPRKHAEMLAPMICELSSAAGVALMDVDTIAVSAGPGSYTGLRIGVSTAKGLAMATGARLVAVPSLEALAVSALPQARAEEYIAAAFPSRREDVYMAVFRVDDSGTYRGRGAASFTREFDDAAMSAAAAAELMTELGAIDEQRVWLVGEGAGRIEQHLSDETIAYAYRLSPSTHHPTGAMVARLGWQRRKSGAFEDVFSFEPFYLRASSARPARQSAFDKLSF